MAPFTFRNIDCGVMEKVWASEAEMLVQIPSYISLILYKISKTFKNFS